MNSKEKEAWIRNERITRPNKLIPYLFWSSLSQLGQIQVHDDTFLFSFIRSGTAEIEEDYNLLLNKWFLTNMPGKHHYQLTWLSLQILSSLPENHTTENPQSISGLLLPGGTQQQSSEELTKDVLSTVYAQSKLVWIPFLLEHHFHNKNWVGNTSVRSEFLLAAILNMLKSQHTISISLSNIRVKILPAWENSVTHLCCRRSSCRLFWKWG